MIRIIIALLVLTIMVLCGVVYHQRLTIKEQQRNYQEIRAEFNEILSEMNLGRN